MLLQRILISVEPNFDNPSICIDYAAFSHEHQEKRREAGIAKDFCTTYPKMGIWAHRLITTPSTGRDGSGPDIWNSCLKRVTCPIVKTPSTETSAKNLIRTGDQNILASITCLNIPSDRGALMVFAPMVLLIRTYSQL